MIMRRLFIGFVIFLGLLALGWLWITKRATDHYFNRRSPITFSGRYVDFPAAQAAGAPGLDCLQKVIPKGSRELNIFVRGEVTYGGFAFPAGEFTALKQRASQINGSVVKENPEDSSTTISFPAKEKEFRMTVWPDPDHPALLNASWNLIDEQ